jgi:hypothetical protein
MDEKLYKVLFDTIDFPDREKYKLIGVFKELGDRKTVRAIRNYDIFQMELTNYLRDLGVDLRGMLFR